MGQPKRRATTVRPKAVGSGIFGHFSNFDECRTEVTGDVLSSDTAEQVGMDVLAKCGDLLLNIGRIILLFVRPDPFYALLWSINCILQPNRNS